MFNHAAITGSAANGIYSQTFITGNYFIVLSLSGDQSVDLELGRNTLSKIEEIVSQSPEISPKEIVEIVKSEFQNGISLDLAVAQIIGQKLIVSGTGEISAKIVRENKIINLLKAGSSISGSLSDKDLLIIGTNEFFPLLTGGDLIKNNDVLELRDSLLPKVETQENNSKIACLFVGVNFSDSTITPLNPPMKDLYLKSRLPVSGIRKLMSANSRQTIYLAIIVLLTLICLVAFQLRSKAIEIQTKTIATMEKQVKEAVDSAKKLSGVNDVMAREILVQVRADFVAKAEASGQTKNEKVKAILTNLDNQIMAVSHIYSVPQLGVFYDFGLLKSGVKVVSSSLVKNEIFALDSANGAVYSVGTKNKTAAVIIGTSDLKSAKLVDGSPESVFVVTSGGIAKIDRSASQTSVKQISPASDKWGEIIGLKAFASNLYLLDKTNSQVWKYQGTEFGFADIAPYLKSGGLDFSKVGSWAIDGYIYVLSGSGNVVRFASGYSDDFKLTGLPNPLLNPTSIFATDETENIYILDNNGSRVVVLDKKGSYLAQYVVADSGQRLAVSTLLVDETVKKVFLVSSDKIYSFDLHTSP